MENCQNEDEGDPENFIMNEKQSMASSSKAHDNPHKSTHQLPLKKARFRWQVKNKKYASKSGSLSYRRLGKHKNISDAHRFISGKQKKQSSDLINCDSSNKNCDSNLEQKKHPANSFFHETNEMNLPDINLSVLQPQCLWSQNRGSPVGILLKSMDEVVELAHRQGNNSMNFQPQQLKHIMKGIADNSINKILEATGTAPGKRSEKSYNVNQEDLEDQAVSVVIRQCGIQAASCSGFSRIVPAYDSNQQNSEKISESKNELNSSSLNSKKLTAETLNNSTSLELKKIPEPVYPNVTQDDIIDAAIFSAINDKGLGILPA